MNKLGWNEGGTQRTCRRGYSTPRTWRWSPRRSSCATCPPKSPIVLLTKTTHEASWRWAALSSRWGMQRGHNPITTPSRPSNTNKTRCFFLLAISRSSCKLRFWSSALRPFTARKKPERQNPTTPLKRPTIFYPFVLLVETLVVIFRSFHGH